MNSRLPNGAASRSSMTEPGLACHLRHLRKRISSCAIPLEEQAHDRRSLGVRHDDLLALRRYYVAISSGARLGQMPSSAFSVIPLRTSSERLSMKFLAISTLMPCMNFSDERESGDRIAPSLTKWMSTP